MDKNAVLRELERRKAKSGTWKAVAAGLGVSQQYLNDVLANRREPAKLMLDGLGLERVISYRRLPK